MLRTFVLSLACSCLFAGGAFAQATVQPTVETGPSPSPGDTADDSVIWIHPTAPGQSLVIGDDKDGGLIVWGLNGVQLEYIDGTLYNNLDLRYNFPMTGTFSDGTSHTHVDLLGVGDEGNNEIDFFKINPATRSLDPAGSIPTPDLLFPYGSCMYYSPVSGTYYYFVNDQNGVVEQYALSGASGTVTGEMVRTFDVGSQTEGCVADDELAQFYVGEEAGGVYKYGAEPGAGATRTVVDTTGGNLTADVEGMTIYYNSDGTGYLIVSSQGDSTFAVYTREGNNSFIGSFQVGSSGSIDAVSGSDGIDVTNFPVGPFANGLLVVHDNANSGADASNHKYVPWERVANALGLTIDVRRDPRQGGGGDPPPPPPCCDPPPPPCCDPPPPPPPPDGDVVEIDGEIDDVSGSCPALTFDVDGTTIVTDAATEYEDGDCEDIEDDGEGTDVEIVGRSRGDGTVLATYVDID